MFDLTRYIEVHEVSMTGIFSTPSYIIMQDWGIRIDMTQVSYHVSMTMGSRYITSHLLTMERSTYLHLPSGSPSPIFTVDKANRGTGYGKRVRISKYCHGYYTNRLL
jgi:hypothetical protein